ncbi:ABC transporter permease [Micromonospora sp. CA-111912]|uniref:ABC transporter permease n=1 Tax=Micromonospora sp. CA-111912 TaxID=3239955 RepID=UPI003D8B5F7D
MTATSLAGRRALDHTAAVVMRQPPRGTSRGRPDELTGRRGGPGRRPTVPRRRPAADQVLIPALGQTCTVGLVTLPGAFVGVLLGGAGPVAPGSPSWSVCWRRRPSSSSPSNW